MRTYGSPAPCWNQPHSTPRNHPRGARSHCEITTSPPSDDRTKQHVKPSTQTVTDDPFLNRVSQKILLGKVTMREGLREPVKPWWSHPWSHPLMSVNVHQSSDQCNDAGDGRARCLVNYYPNS